MKLSLRPLASFASALTFALVLSTAPGCSSDPVPDAPPPDAPPAASGTDAPPQPARKLVTKGLMPTPAENLVVDPEFQSLWAALDETGFGIYEAFVQDGTGDVSFMPITPAGPGAATLAVKPNAGSAATLTMSVVGGKGPFSARVWVAAAKGEQPHVEFISLLDNSAIELAPDESTRATIGDVDWIQHVGSGSGDMPGALYLAATVARPARFVAPQVSSRALAPTKSLPTHASGPAPVARVAASPRATNAARALERLRSKYVTMKAPPALTPKVAGMERGPVRR